MFTPRFTKNFITRTLANKNTEGYTIKTIATRLKDERLQKLNEIMDKLGVIGETESDRLRFLIDKLHDLVVKETLDPRSNLTPIKQCIKVTQGIMWITCPKDNQAHRINDCHNCNDPKFSNCKEAVKKYMEA